MELIVLYSVLIVVSVIGIIWNVVAMRREERETAHNSAQL
jgi:hypothetical protein